MLNHVITIERRICIPYNGYFSGGGGGKGKFRGFHGCVGNSGIFTHE